MSEYVTVEVEYGDDLDVVELYINQTLTSEAEERYVSRSHGDQGSPIAQMLFAAVEGIEQLIITEDGLTISRGPDHPWEAIIDEVRAALRDWFL